MAEIQDGGYTYGAFKHTGGNIGASKHTRGIQTYGGIQTYREVSKQGAFKHTGGHPNMWASKHTGDASNHMGASKHTGGVQT